MHALRNFHSLLLLTLTFLYAATSLPAAPQDSVSIIQEHSLIANTSLPWEFSDSDADPGPGSVPEDVSVPFRSSILDASLRYQEAIPDTELTLFWGYTTFLTRKTKIRSLILETASRIETQIKLSGSSAKLPIAENTKGRQYFRNSINNGFALEVENVDPYAVTWGDLKQLMVGLAAKCGGQLCAFEFRIGKGPRVGKGKIATA